MVTPAMTVSIPGAGSQYSMATVDSEGEERNWIQTIPGKGFNVILRFYGPLQPWFDQTWRPGEIERVQ